jgi:hypothetical protein
MSVSSEIINDLKTRWANAPALDALDVRGYNHALEPLERAIASGKISETDPIVWKIRFGIRKCRFRPGVGEVEEIVMAGLPQTNFVEAPPSPHAAEAPVLDARSRWHCHLSLSNDEALDSIMDRTMEAIRQRHGEEAAVRAAKAAAQGRIDRKGQLLRDVDGILGPIPSEERSAWMGKARAALPATAYELVVARRALDLWRKGHHREDKSKTLSQWRSAWIPAGMEIL